MQHYSANRLLLLLSSVLVFIFLVFGQYMPNNSSYLLEDQNIGTFSEYYKTDSKDCFLKDIKADMQNYSTAKETSSSKLYKLEYYYDFESLPDSFKIDQIIVSHDCNNLDIQYIFNNEIVDIFWFRAIDDPNYDFISDTRQLFSEYDGSLFTFRDVEILLIEHKENELCPEAYNQYSFVYEGDNLEISVPKVLIEEFGENLFLSIKQIKTI